MASFEKYKHNQCKYLIGHNSRQYKALDKHIDYNLSCLNYNLAPDREEGYFDLRLQELNCSKRKDVNAVAELIVSLPKSFKGNEKEFFNAVYDFCKKKYKENNILCAWVHKDEPAAVSHIHVTFIPTSFDRKKGVPVVSYDKCVYKHLNKFHPELSKYLEYFFGYDVGVINGATRGGNKSINQLKAETKAKSELVDLKKLKARYEKQMESYLSFDDKMLFDKLKKDNQILKKQNAVYSRFIDEFGLGEDFADWRKFQSVQYEQKKYKKFVEKDNLQR